LLFCALLLTLWFGYLKLKHGIRFGAVGYGFSNLVKLIGVERGVVFNFFMVQN
tara:strand:- start:261 stop:419 length:159 start_codon:yes stop_codon:yes gene_type:complete